MIIEPDWYQCTIKGLQNPDHVASRLLMGSLGLVLREASGGFNRPFSLRGEMPGGGSVGIYYGSDLDVHVLGSSNAAPHVMEVVREHWPAHTVSRFDACADFDEPGAFDRLWRAVYALARTPRRGGRGGMTSTSTVGDWIDAENGRTFYAGSRGSQYVVRVYEKGLEQRAKHPDVTFSPDWVRVEAEVRPQGKGKLLAATATPAEMFAWSALGSDILRAIADLEVESIAPARVASTDPEYWLAQQYGPILRGWADLPLDELRDRVLGVLALTAPRPEPVRA